MGRHPMWVCYARTRICLVQFCWYGYERNLLLRQSSVNIPSCLLELLPVVINKCYFLNYIIVLFGKFGRILCSDLVDCFWIRLHCCFHVINHQYFRFILHLHWFKRCYDKWLCYSVLNYCSRCLRLLARRFAMQCRPICCWSHFVYSPDWCIRCHLS